MTSNNHNHYSSSDIQRYKNGGMSAEEMHAFERAALEDPFLSDALDGYAAVGNIELDEDLTQLQARLKNRVEKEDESSGARAMGWWKIAALLVLFAGGAGLYYTLNNSSETENITIAKNESAETLPPLADSLTDDILSLNEPAQGGKAAQQALSQPQSEPVTKKVPFKPGRQEEEAAPATNQDNAAADKSGLPSARMMKRDQQADAAVSEERQKDIAKVKEIQASQTAEAFTGMNNFRGRVVDDSGKPVPGASVMVLNSQLGISTDTGGYFNFSFVDSTARVAVSTSGYSPARATLKTNVPNNEIRLYQTSPLAEITMTSRSGSMRKASPAPGVADTLNKPAIPVTGWIEFEHYLEKNKVIPETLKNVHGEIVLSFVVDASGKPTELVVEKSLDAALDREAIRLVREGPAWTVKNAANAKGSVTIRF